MSRNVYNYSSSSQYNDYLAEPVSTYSPQTSPIQNNDSVSEDSHFPSSSTLHATSSPSNNPSGRPSPSRQSFETTETSNWSAADSSYSNSQQHHGGGGGGSLGGYDQQQPKNPFADSGRAGDEGIQHRGVPSTQSRGSFASWNGSASRSVSFFPSRERAELGGGRRRLRRRSLLAPSSRQLLFFPSSRDSLLGSMRGICFFHELRADHTFCSSFFALSPSQTTVFSPLTLPSLDPTLPLVLSPSTTSLQNSQHLTSKVNGLIVALK